MKDTSTVTPDATTQEDDDKNPGETSESGTGKEYLSGMLNKLMKIKLSDGRILIGVFLCTDRDSNVILGSCSEYVMDQGNEDGEPERPDDATNELNEYDPTLNIEPRILGLAMVPGKHIVSIHLDELPESQNMSNVPVNSPVPVRRAKEMEEGSNINLTEDSFDIDLEAATKKIESMYT
jgi:small nuclear ribonucleoprotein (snRNP)-like protein